MKRKSSRERGVGPRAMCLLIGAVLLFSCTRRITTNRRPSSPGTASQGLSAVGGGPTQARRPSIEEAEARFYALRGRAEAGEPVDFRELRFAWLYGPSIKRREKLRTLPALRREMVRTIEKGGEPQSVLAKARDILDIAYVDLDAHKARHQACALLRESVCAELGHAIEFGMFKSVIQSGDGKTCASGWKVVTSDEESFVLRMAGARLKSQTMVSHAGNHCDAMLVDRDGREETMYFQVTELQDASAQPSPPATP